MDDDLLKDFRHICIDAGFGSAPQAIRVLIGAVIKNPNIFKTDYTPKKKRKSTKKNQKPGKGSA